MKSLKNIIKLINFIYLKKKLDLKIKNSKGYGFCALDDKIIFNKNAYSKIAIEERDDGTYSIVYFYCSKNYIIFRYNYCLEPNCNSNWRYKIIKKVNSLEYNSLSKNYLKDVIQRLCSHRESYNLYPIFRKHIKLYNNINSIFSSIVN